MIKSALKTGYSKFALISLVPITVTTFSVYFTDFNHIDWLRMGWNYFLAVIPLYMSLFAGFSFDKHKRVQGMVFTALWLLFFPNSIYMITDFKYMCWHEFQLWEIISLNRETVNGWLLLANLVVSVGAGVICGLMSLDVIHSLARKTFSRGVCAVIITLVSLLSSFGVYIGRFARLNSWDVIMPWKIVEKTMSVMTPFASAFILIFTILTLLLYSGFYFLKRIKS